MADKTDSKRKIEHMSSSVAFIEKAIDHLGYSGIKFDEEQGELLIIRNMIEIKKINMER